jgi:hypothetical protein
MGFNKRIISYEMIQKRLDSQQSFIPLFNSDALIFKDEISSKVLDWLLEGLSEEQIELKLKQYKNENN